MAAEGNGGVPPAVASPAVKLESDTAMADAPIPSITTETSSAHTATAVASMPRQTDSAGATNGSSSTQMPKEPAHHGAPTRDWINTKVTGVLLEGMKLLAAERPEAPLKALGEYLLKRSAEIEGTDGTGTGVNGQ